MAAAARSDARPRRATAGAGASSPAPFFLGANVPWNRFGYDIGGGAWDVGWFDDYLRYLANSSANTARVFLHADARATPSFDAATRMVSGLSASFLPQLLALAGIAWRHSLVLQLCLWSFDLCEHHAPGAGLRADLIRDAAKTESYITHALRPMLSALDGAVGRSRHVVIEVINEPEWCVAGADCSTAQCVERIHMQRFIGSIAAAVHRHSALAVTVGSASLKWSGKAGSSAVGDWWSDEALRAAVGGGTRPGEHQAGGERATDGNAADPLGVGEELLGAPAAQEDPCLDFYSVHFWEWMVHPQWGYDPCRVPASHWQQSKPTAIGEMPDTTRIPAYGELVYSSSRMLDCLAEHGFQGGLFWAHNDPARPITTAYASMSRFASMNRLAPQVDVSTDSLLRWLAQLRTATPTNKPPPEAPPPPPPLRPRSTLPPQPHPHAPAAPLPSALGAAPLPTSPPPGWLTSDPLPVSSPPLPRAPSAASSRGVEPAPPPLDLDLRTGLFLGALAFSVAALGCGLCGRAGWRGAHRRSGSEASACSGGGAGASARLAGRHAAAGCAPAAPGHSAAGGGAALELPDLAGVGLRHGVVRTTVADAPRQGRAAARPSRARGRGGARFQRLSDAPEVEPATHDGLNSSGARGDAVQRPARASVVQR
jgi:hypothetical protein